jgi:hypothetical protein
MILTKGLYKISTFEGMEQRWTNQDQMLNGNGNCSVVRLTLASNESIGIKKQIESVPLKFLPET